MKNLLVILFMLVSFGAMSQATNDYTAFFSDSTVNSETVVIAIDDPAPIKRNHAITMTIVPVNTSGTATVNCMPQGSFDGTVFFDLQANPDTINLAGTVAKVKYEYADANWRYYQCSLISTGTGVTDITGDLGLKKKY